MIGRVELNGDPDTCFSTFLRAITASSIVSNLVILSLFDCLALQIRSGFYRPLQLAMTDFNKFVMRLSTPTCIPPKSTPVASRKKLSEKAKHLCLRQLTWVFDPVLWHTL